MSRKKPTIMAQEALNRVRDEVDYDQSSGMRIVSLVGTSNTGKTQTLNLVIDQLRRDNVRWDLIDEARGNRQLGALNPGVVGSDADAMAIYRRKNTSRQLGIITTGDSVNINVSSLIYLANRGCNVVLIASHPVAFKNLIFQLDPTAIQIGTHYIDDQNLQNAMMDTNVRIIVNALNHVLF